MRRSGSVAVLTCLAFVWALLWPNIARAGDAPPPPSSPPVTDGALLAAKQHFEAGRAAYDAGDYARAIHEFKAAEIMRPAPILSYNIGLANDKLSRPRAAIRYYRHYLEALPQAPNRADVEQAIARLEKQIAMQPPSTPPEPTQDPTSAVVDPSGPPPPMAVDANAPHASYDPYARAPIPVAPPPKRRNLWWVWLIVGIGAAGVLAAIIAVSVVATRNAERESEDGAKIDSSRLPTAATNRSIGRSIGDRRDLFDRGSSGPQAAQVAPLFQLHF